MVHVLEASWSHSDLFMFRGLSYAVLSQHEGRELLFHSLLLPQHLEVGRAHGRGTTSTRRLGGWLWIVTCLRVHFPTVSTLRAGTVQGTSFVAPVTPRTVAQEL